MKIYDNVVVIIEILITIIYYFIKDFNKREDSIIKRLINENKVIIIVFNEEDVSINLLIAVITIN